MRQVTHRQWRYGWIGAAVAVLALFTASCGGEDAVPSAKKTTSATPSATPTPTGPCGLAEGEEIDFPAGRGDARLHGVLAGSGSVGVILAHELRKTGCSWSFYAERLVSSGHQVLMLDFAGNGKSDRIGDGRFDLDVLAAAKVLRERGATTLVAIGASMGATAVVAASADPDGGIDAVVSLSAVARLGLAETDAIAAAPAIKVPAVFVASESDGAFADTARQLADSCACSWRKLLILDGGRHGVQTLGGDSTDVQALIDELFAEVS